MAQERWDVVLEVLDGPMASMGEQTLRGPVVRLGSNPGPGGFKFNGYRGLDARHAVISAYAEGEATIAPVGSNQVRMAPHPHVRWKDIDPMPGPEYLSEGCAIHLGPVGRGATFQFKRIERLGVWQQGQLASEVALPDGGGEVQQTEAIRGVGSGAETHARHPSAAAINAPPAAIDARRVRRVGTGNSKVFAGVGCLTITTMACAGGILAGVFINQRDVEELGPKEEGEPFYEFARFDPEEEINPVLYSGLEQAFSAFVMEDNEAVSGRRFPKSENWDRRFYDYTARSVEMHLRSWSVFRRLDDVRDDYAFVLKALRREGLPDAIAAVPYLESRYRAEEQSGACAKGYWQWMPESGPRFTAAGLDFKVAECTFRNAPADFKWSPTAYTPPKGVFKNAAYVDTSDAVSKYDEKKCRIPKSRGCKYDSRTDLGKSTAAAIFAIGEAYRDPTIKKSGAAVQIAIASHHGGYDDSQFGVPKSFNLLPAYQTWSKKKDQSEHHKFYGENLLCEDNESEKRKGFCGSTIAPGTQHYAYTVVAEHMLAACYYGLNYSSMPEFKDYARFTRGDGYCVKLGIPGSDEVRAKGKGG
ncbi:MAG: hypothetical protein EP330_04290 [Deltaproteobacteria bacterium]|nr:MAG: hypothetical protein EP330_04290 [Deltaproteobacteria bacterium]